MEKNNKIKNEDDGVKVTFSIYKEWIVSQKLSKNANFTENETISQEGLYYY